MNLKLVSNTASCCSHLLTSTQGWLMQVKCSQSENSTSINLSLLFAEAIIYNKYSLTSSWRTDCTIIISDHYAILPLWRLWQAFLWRSVYWLCLLIWWWTPFKLDVFYLNSVMAQLHLTSLCGGLELNKHTPWAPVSPTHSLLEGIFMLVLAGERRLNCSHIF